MENNIDEIIKIQNEIKKLKMEIKYLEKELLKLTPCCSNENFTKVSFSHIFSSYK